MPSLWVLPLRGAPSWKLLPTWQEVVLHSGGLAVLTLLLLREESHEEGTGLDSIGSQPGVRVLGKSRAGDSG